MSAQSVKLELDSVAGLVLFNYSSTEWCCFELHTCALLKTSVFLPMWPSKKKKTLDFSFHPVLNTNFLGDVSNMFICICANQRTVV